jgi:segregation and condensation protein A
MDIVCAFLAVLDAVKHRLVMIFQHKLFGDIEIRAWRLEGEAPSALEGEI